VSSYETNRKIALVLAFLRKRLKGATPYLSKEGKRGKDRTRLSIEDIAALLAAAQVSGRAVYDFTRENTDALLKGIADLEAAEEECVLAALNSLVQKTERPWDLKSSVPLEIEAEFSMLLPEWLKIPWPVFAPTNENLLISARGVEFGGTGALLAGIWQCFYIRPVPEPDIREPQLQGFALCFRPASASSMHVHFIGHNRNMEGSAVLIERHLYLALTHHEGANASLIIVNAPIQRSLRFAGTGTGLAHPDNDENVPSAVAFACFGQKWHPDSSDKNQRTREAAERLVHGDSLDPVQRKCLQDEFCKKYVSISAFKTDLELLCKFIDKHSIGGQKGLSSCGVFLQYP